ncbi:MAG: alpha/beta hydrolase family protein [Solirubrobacterales bacterium]
MTVSESDAPEVERFYQTLSTWIRLHGAEHMARQYVVIRLARIEATGPLDFSDIQRVLSGVVDARAWYPAWHDEAQQAEEAAERLLAEERKVSAADMFHRASACHHWSQYLARVGSEEKAEGRRGRVRCYRSAVGCFPAQIGPVNAPFDGAALPGYLHLPEEARVTGEPPACVIMINGADSVKEEYHNWARQFVRRGLAVLTIDGPGQGEMAGVIPMNPDAWEQPMGAAIDALSAGGKVDTDRIGVWGSSMGGFLALRAAAYERRVRAAISSGGFYDFRDYLHWPISTQLNVMEDLMLESLSAAREYMTQNCTLDGVVERIEVPYLVIHGARDDLVGVEEGRQMATGPLGEFVNFEDGFHTCTNYNAALVTLMCDWMAEKLHSDGP